MADKLPLDGYVRAEDFFRTAEPTNIFDEVRELVNEESLNASLDVAAVRQQEDWGFLANKIVGAERS